MEPAEVFRAVRRRQGWSQRELAARSGVTGRTIAAVESGARAPSLPVLRQVLAAADLELTLDRPPPAVDDRVRRYLRLSLARRLHRALGGDGVPCRSRAAVPVWDQLVRLAGCGTVVLHGEAALALWLPATAPLTTVDVCFRRVQPWPVPETPDVTVREECHQHATAVVAVSVGSWALGVDPPADLALNLDAVHERPRLRAGARLLHDQAARDLAGRRARAHRDPAHAQEAHYVFRTKRCRNLRMPDETDRRGWRLGDDASLASWLLSYGYGV